MHFESFALFVQSEQATWVQELLSTEPIGAGDFFQVDCDSDFNNCPFRMISWFLYTRRNFISEYKMKNILKLLKPIALTVIHWKLFF